MAQRLKDWIKSIKEQRHKIAPHPDDEELFSSVNDVNNLQETQVWQDMMQLADDRREVLRMALVEARDYERIRRIQESIKAWEDIKLLPELLKTFVKMQQDEPK